MSNKIKLFFVLLVLNNTVTAQSSWVYPDNVINNRFLVDALDLQLKRPGLSINGFTGSNHGLGVKEILVRYSENDSTVIRVNSRIVSTSEQSIIYYSGIPSSETLNNLLTIYNDNADAMADLRAKLIFISELNSSGGFHGIYQFSDKHLV
jgi:hypothetical protein